MPETNKLNAMLNTQDASEYLKLSPDGIEVCYKIGLLFTLHFFTISFSFARTVLLMQISFILFHVLIIATKARGEIHEY